MRSDRKDDVGSSDDHEAPVADQSGVRRRPLRDVGYHRNTLHQSDALLIQDLALPFTHALGHDCSPDGRFAFPYFGAFRWRVGSFERLIDPNTVLTVNSDEEFFESHPTEGTGHASVIFTPSPALLDELRALARRGDNGRAPIVSPTPNRTRLAIHNLRHGMCSPLESEEVAVDLMGKAMRAEARFSSGTSRLVELAKEILYAHFAEPVTLEWIARELGVTAVYLTQTFRRQEGVPLYRYQTSLRLNRALLLLPECDGITELALDLGYSSHAHFTSAFSAAFGMTPKAYRATRRGSSQRKPAVYPEQRLEEGSAK